MRIMIIIFLFIFYHHHRIFIYLVDRQLKSSSIAAQLFVNSAYVEISGQYVSFWLSAWLLDYLLINAWVIMEKSLLMDY